MMEASRKAYPALLAALDSGEAVTVLNDRIDAISRTNKDIADWLLERRKIEETYAQSLRKLARKPQRDGGLSMGVIQTPWQRIVESTESLAQSHEILARKIEVDAEVPLRQFASSNKDMQSMAKVQGDLIAIAKDSDSAQKKADKLKDKTGKNSSTRAATATSSADDATQQWESQSQYAFEQLQVLDEARINHLRGVLTQFQTHEVDSIEQNRKPAELCLNALLNVETADEIKNFVARISTGPRHPPATRRRSSASNTVSRFSSANILSAPPIPPPPRLTTDRSRPSTGQQTENSDTTETPKKQGLKSRLGTVIGRRKHAGTPPVTPADRMKKERNRTSFMPSFRRGDSSKSQTSGENFAQLGDWASPGKSQEPPPVEKATSITDSDRRLRIPDGSAVNGTTNDQQRRPSDIITPVEAPTRSSNGFAPAPEQPHELSVSPPSPVMHMDPISRAQQEALSLSEHDDAIRKLKIRDQPIQEDESEAQQAMNTMASQLRMQAQSSGVNRLNSSVRGRRDVRNTVFVPSPETQANDGEVAVEPSVAASSLRAPTIQEVPEDQTTVSPIKAPGIFQEEKTLSDTTSVHSAQSLGALVHHPELHQPGLNSSIVETVSTWFSDGAVSKSFVIGEIALALNSPETVSESETIRLENFQVLEKIAPNPNFVTASHSEKGKEKATAEEGAGEYTIAVAAIKRSSPVVAFKYQIHLDPANLSAFSPVLITPAWQIQDTQASVIVVYTLNPAFTFKSTTTSITLKNVTVSVSLDASTEAGKATSAMMAPQVGGTFKKKQGLVIWKLPELVVSSDQQKLLVRFMTTGPKARAGHVDAKWELSGTSGSKIGVSVLTGAEKSQDKAGDPFADEGNTPGSSTRTWNEAHTSRRLISGKYSAS